MPPAQVLDAFGVAGPATLLAGGQGTSWRAGHLVLKPEVGAAHEWLADVAEDGFRLARPARTRDGAWSHDGWSATHWVDGVEAWDFRTVIAAGRAFHRAVAHLGRPAGLDDRDDRWAVADRIAWGEREAAWRPGFADIARRLDSALQPLGPAQIVHCDLTQNVLVAPGQPPAVIDVSPYWRPPAYADGVVIADALTWHDAPGSLAAETGVSVPAVARALLFRMATDVVDDWAWRYDRATTAIGL
nr:TIGR02569 family protein [Actinoplanes ovalisporus]